jgi:CBS domain-containing protein/DNA-binding CsgD family transcriptional regulator
MTILIDTVHAKEVPCNLADLSQGLFVFDDAAPNGDDAAILFSRIAADNLTHLTQRQTDVLDLLLAGHASKSIAYELKISQRTVENHRAALAKRMDARTLPELIHSAVCGRCSTGGHDLSKGVDGKLVRSGLTAEEFGGSISTSRSGYSSARSVRRQERQQGDSMFVDELLPAARKRLVTIAEDTSLIEVAGLLHRGTDLVVVCRTDGMLVGVVTKTDVVAQISNWQGTSRTCPLSIVMTRDPLLCRAGDTLLVLWGEMKARGFKNVPFVDGEGRPLGVVTARDALEILLVESGKEEVELRDYIMGVGYR